MDEATLGKVLQGCEMALELDASKKTILEFVEDRMQWIAPNLSIITGSAIAAQLMGVAGGLHNLSRMPACNVQVTSTPPPHSPPQGVSTLKTDSNLRRRRCWARRRSGWTGSPPRR